MLTPCRNIADKTLHCDFADSFVVRRAVQESLVDLNAHLGKAVPMNRFRPNLVTTGGTPWAEDTWESFQIAGPGRKALAFANVKPCSRCKVGARGRSLDCRGLVQGVG